MSVHSKLLNKYGTFGDYFLLSPDSTVIVYGKSNKHEDLVIRSHTNINQDRYLLFDLDGSMNVNEKEISDLFQKTIKKMSSGLIEGFNLNRQYVEALRDTINMTDSTHLRFHNEDTELKVSVFNYRQFITKVNIRTPNTPFISESTIKNSYVSGDINFTIDARTFLKLPDESYQVESMENGLINFLNLDTEMEFFIREQEIQEPTTKFTNEKLDLETVFLFQPKIT